MYKTVNIDGKKFNLDVTAAQKRGCLVPVELITVGQYYERIATGEKYILASISDDEAALISLSYGGRHAAGVEVKEFDDITIEEFKEICADEGFDRVYSFQVGNPKKKKH